VIHFPGAAFQLVFYGTTVLAFFALLYRWRNWYVDTTDAALAGRSLWAIVGVSLLFTAVWLTCGKTAFGVKVLKWAISPVVCAGFACLVKAAGPAPAPKATG
jgi:multisubunit Na+/H+ antiporter MnhB subunit